MLSSLVACALAALCAPLVRAQTIRGSMVLPDGVTPAAGVIVLIEDARGALASRGLTDTRGNFVATMARGGTFRARALRVGFQPTVSSPIDVGDSVTVAMHMVLDAVVVSLPSITVRGKDICRGQTTDGAVVAAVWEEARKALLSSSMTTASTPLVAEWVEYERMLDASARFVRAQHVKSTVAATSHAFRSAPWQQLAEQGYVVDTVDGSVFHAPDADVLLSDSFAALHCFHLEPPNDAHRNEIGVGFRPAVERRAYSDIEGTFWIDRASSELRTLEFHYTNLPAIAERAQPGGDVEFLRLTSGSWLVRRWRIRMPQLSNTAPTMRRGRSVTVLSSTLDLSAIRVVGGDVSLVRRGDSTLFRASGASLNVAVTATDTGVSRRDARVSLLGTDYSTFTGVDGRARFAPILSGQYRVQVQSPLMDSLGVMTDPVEIVVKDNESRNASVVLPTLQTLLKKVCGDQASSGDGAQLRGVVVDSTGMPVENASVRLVWQQQISVVRDRLMWSDQAIETTSDTLGGFRVCGVPRGQSVSVRVQSPMGIGRANTRIAESAVFASTRVMVMPESAADAARAASVTITVADSTGHAIRDALVDVVDKGRTPLHLRSDSIGRVSLSSLPAGSITIDVRKVGFASGSLTSDIERGENTVLVVLYRAGAPRLADIRVVADRVVPPRHAAFQQRLERGDATATVTMEELDRRGGSATWQFLTRLPSIQVLDSLGYIYARSMRQSTILCWPRVAIDGKIFTGRPNLALLPPPSEIFGIEIFSGPARLPIDIAGEGEERFCGLISITTR